MEDITAQMQVLSQKSQSTELQLKYVQGRLNDSSQTTQKYQQLGQVCSWHNLPVMLLLLSPDVEVHKVLSGSSEMMK